MIQFFPIDPSESFTTQLRRRAHCEIDPSESFTTQLRRRPHWYSRLLDSLHFRLKNFRLLALVQKLKKHVSKIFHRPLPGSLKPLLFSACPPPSPHPLSPLSPHFIFWRKKMIIFSARFPIQYWPEKCMCFSPHHPFFLSSPFEKNEHFFGTLPNSILTRKTNF